MNIVEKLSQEIERVSRLVVIYEDLPEGAGAMAAILMRNDLQLAHKSQASGDIQNIITSIKILEEYTE